MSKEILSRALELAKQGIPDEGINLLRPLLGQPEFQKDAIYLMAFCYEQKRDHATAIHLYGQLVKLDPVNAAPSERLKSCHAALSQSVATAESQTGWGKRCTILLPLLVVLGGVALGMAIATPELLYYGEAVLPSIIGGGFLLFIAFLLLLGGIRRVFIRASSIRQAQGTDYTNQRQRTCWACGLSVPEKGGRCLFCQSDKKQPENAEESASGVVLEGGTVILQQTVPTELEKQISAPVPVCANPIPAENKEQASPPLDIAINVQEEKQGVSQQPIIEPTTKQGQSSILVEYILGILLLPIGLLVLDWIKDGHIAFTGILFRISILCIFIAVVLFVIWVLVAKKIGIKKIISAAIGIGLVALVLSDICMSIIKERTEGKPSGGSVSVSGAPAQMQQQTSTLALSKCKNLKDQIDKDPGQIATGSQAKALSEAFEEFKKQLETHKSDAAWIEANYRYAMDDLHNLPDRLRSHTLWTCGFGGRQAMNLLEGYYEEIQSKR